VAKKDLLKDPRSWADYPDRDNQSSWWEGHARGFDSRHGYRVYLCSHEVEDILTMDGSRTLEAGSAWRGMPILGLTV